MIDFNNSSFLKLRQVKPEEGEKAVASMLIDGEQVLSAYKSVRDCVVFTDKRAIAVNVQGMTGKKRDYTTMPYSKITSFSVETAGVMDIDCELMDCYEWDINRNNDVTFSTYDFPVLVPGETRVEFGEGNIRAIQLVPRWWRV